MHSEECGERVQVCQVSGALGRSKMQQRFRNYWMMNSRKYLELSEIQRRAKKAENYYLGSSMKLQPRLNGWSIQWFIKNWNENKCAARPSSRAGEIWPILSKNRTSLWPGNLLRTLHHLSQKYLYLRYKCTSEQVCVTTRTGRHCAAVLSIGNRVEAEAF